MTSRLKNSAGADLDRGLDNDLGARLSGRRMFEPLMATFSIITIAASTMAPMAMGDTAGT